MGKKKSPEHAKPEEQESPFKDKTEAKLEVTIAELQVKLGVPPEPLPSRPLVVGHVAVTVDTVLPAGVWHKIAAVVTSVLVDAKHKFSTQEQLVPRLKYIMAELTPTLCQFVPVDRDGNGPAQVMAGLLFVVALKDADDIPALTAPHAVRAALESEDGRIMLRRIAGRPTPLPTETPVAGGGPAFRFMDERTIEWRGKTYRLNLNQSIIIKTLYKAYEDGLPEVYYKKLQKAVYKKRGEIRGSFEVRGFFKSRNRELFHHRELVQSDCLIVKGEGKGTYRLNLPAKPTVH
jgi:hypothetical protein